MVKVLEEPSVYVLGHSKYDNTNFRDYILDEGLEDALYREGTPADKLAHKSQTMEALAEVAGRKCYNAWSKGRPTDEYFEHIMEVGHGSILTHCNITFLIADISRSCSMEFIRHHVGVGISQESQRFINYKEPVMVMHPSLQRLDDSARQQAIQTFTESFEVYAERQGQLKKYFKEAGLEGTMLRKRVNEGARMCLPNETATSLVWTANARALRNVLTERGGIMADLEIRQLAVALFNSAKRLLPNILKDFKECYDDQGFPYLETTYGKV